MVFGDVLAHAQGKTIFTADNVQAKITPVAAIALRIIGIPHTGVRERARHILKHIGDKRRTILDAGCGIGIYSLTLAKLGHRVTGLDIDVEKIRTAREINESAGLSVRFDTGNLADITTKDNFDVIICSDVIEHILNDEAVIQNLSGLLSPGGRIILTVPNMTEHNIKHYLRYGHVRPGYFVNQLETLLEKNNLKVIVIKGYGHPLSAFAFYINEKLLRMPIVLGILFIPLYLLTYVNLFGIKNCDGILVVAEKTQ